MTILYMSKIAKYKKIVYAATRCSLNYFEIPIDASEMSIRFKLVRFIYCF